MISVCCLHMQVCLCFAVKLLLSWCTMWVTFCPNQHLETLLYWLELPALPAPEHQMGSTLPAESAVTATLLIAAAEP